MTAKFGRFCEVAQYYQPINFSSILRDLYKVVKECDSLFLKTAYRLEPEYRNIGFQ